MKQVKKLLLYCLASLLPLVFISCAKTSAISTVKRYVQAIKEDKKEIAKEYVAREDEAQFLKDYEDIKRGITDATLKVLHFEKYNDAYRVLVFIDSKHPVHACQKYFYLVKEDERMKVTFPYSILCKDWDTIDGEYAIFHFSNPKRKNEVKKAVTTMDNYYLMIRDFLPPQDFLKKIDYYLCQNVEEMNKILGYRNKLSKGHAVAKYRTVFSTFPFDSLAYIASLLTGRPAFLKLGLYLYSQKKREWGGYPYEGWASKVVYRINSFEKSISSPGYNIYYHGCPAIWARHLCSFCFLMSRLGQKDFKTLIHKSTSENIIKNLEEIAGEDVEKLEEEWTRYIDNEAIRVIGMDSLFTPYFKIYYDREFKFIAEEITKPIEDGYKRVCNDLSYFPEERIVINLLNKENFSEKVAGSGEGAVYNGEIFLNTQIGAPPEYISSVILHELSHLFVRRIVKKERIYHRLPVWFSEGLARYEGREREFILLNWGNVFDFTLPEKLKLPQNSRDTRRNIAWELSSYSAVEFLFENWGKEKMNELLRLFAETGSFDDAFKETYGMSQSKFERLWREKIKEKFWSY